MRKFARSGIWLGHRRRLNERNRAGPVLSDTVYTILGKPNFVSFVHEISNNRIWLEVAIKSSTNLSR